MEIEIYSDVVCPWCYLGRRRLEAALDSVDADVIVRWRAFQLDPGLPREGQPLLDWLAGRFGGRERAHQTVAHVTAVAEAEGLRLNFDRALIANTFDAHRLLWFADQPQSVFFGAGAQTQAELAEAIQHAHFTEGRDIGSHDVLVDLADEAGLEARRVRRMLISTEGIADVRGQLAHAYDLGITAVPTFVLAGKYAVTGAQGVTGLRSVLAEVLRREGMSGTVRSVIPVQRPALAAEQDFAA